MPRIEIRIPRDPKKPRTVKVEGVNGPSCQELTKGIEHALGNTVSDVQTEEFYKEQDQHVEEHLDQEG